MVHVGMPNIGGNSNIYWYLSQRPNIGMGLHGSAPRGARAADAESVTISLHARVCDRGPCLV